MRLMLIHLMPLTFYHYVLQMRLRLKSILREYEHTFYMCSPILSALEPLLSRSLTDKKAAHSVYPSIAKDQIVLYFVLL